MKHALFAFSMMLAPAALAGPIVLRDARVFTGEGDALIEATIVVDKGVITYVGDNPRRIPAKAEVRSLQGKIVTPGLTDSLSTLGMEEVGLSTRSEDAAFEGNDMGAAVNPVLSFNQRSSLIPIFLEEGVTQVVLRQYPTKSVLAGRVAMVSLAGDADRLDPPHGVLAYLGEHGRGIAGKSRGVALQRLLIALDEAAFHVDNARDANSRVVRDLTLPRADLQALAPVVRGEQRLAVYIDRASDMERLLGSIPEGVRLVLVGAREAWKVRGLLAERGIPVVINPLDNLPGSFDRLGARLDHAALLHEAGVLFSFMTEDTYTESRMLAQGAGNAVAHGLPWAEGLRAMTVNAARIWGTQAGTLAPDRDATLVVWNADPLEVTSHVEAVMVGGEWISVENRQNLLRDRYSDVDDKTEPFGYR